MPSEELFNYRKKREWCEGWWCGWGKKHDSIGTDVEILQPAISRVLTLEMPFWPWLKLCTLLLDLFFPLSQFNCMWRAKAREEGQQRVRSDGEGTGRVVFHSLWKRLHECVSSRSLSLALDWPWVERWLYVLEIRFYYRHRLRACQLWPREGTNLDQDLRESILITTQICFIKANTDTHPRVAKWVSHKLDQLSTQRNSLVENETHTTTGGHG